MGASSPPSVGREPSGVAPAPTLLSVFATFAVGGQQVRFARVVNHLGARWRHVIVSMDGERAAAGLLDPALDVTYPDLAVPKGDTLGNARRLRRLLRAWAPTVLLTHNWGSIEWALANAPPLLPRVVRHVHIEDGFGPEERDRQLPRRAITRRVALRRCTLVVPSRTLWRIARETWRMPERILRFVPNSVDVARFPTPAALDGATIGTVAALRPEKNIARLVRAFALVAPRVPAARLLIVGDGPERPGLEALAAELSIADRVRFAGHSANPAGLIASMDVFAITSDTEQMPLSVLEAMAAGVPVVATDVGDLREMLPQSGLDWVVPRDDAAVAAALTAALGDRDRARALGALNRERALERYDQPLMLAAYARILAAEA